MRHGPLVHVFLAHTDTQYQKFLGPETKYLQNKDKITNITRRLCRKCTENGSRGTTTSEVFYELPLPLATGKEDGKPSTGIPPNLLTVYR